MASTQGNDLPVSPTTAQADIGETFLTLLAVAERLKVNEDTVRRLFLSEPGVLVICFPRKGKRVYSTVRIPEMSSEGDHALVHGGLSATECG